MITRYPLYKTAFASALALVYASLFSNAALTLRQSNGTSGSAYSSSIGQGAYTASSVTLQDASTETLRGQTFIARTPSEEEAGWNLTSVTLRFLTNDGLPTVGPSDVWTLTVVEWDPLWDAGDFTAWLAGASDDPLAGFASPNIVVQDSGAFDSETDLISRSFFIFDLDPSEEYFIEAGKAYAVYLSYSNPSGDGLLVETRIPEEHSGGSMIHQGPGSAPSVTQGEMLTVWVHGDAATPDDGRDLAPRFTLSDDIELPLNLGAYSESHVSDFHPFNPGQALVGYTVENDNNDLFSIQPSIDNEGNLTFTPAPDTPGVANLSVYATDSGATNNRSYVQTFSITITDREVTTIHVDADTPAAPEAQDGLSWDTAFASLQDGLAAAVDLDEIWIAEGAYYPDEAVAGIADVADNDKQTSFQLRDKVAVYGGFSGNEQSRDERDHVANPTILSGDIDRDTHPDIAPNRVVLDSPETNVRGVNANLVVEGTDSGDAILDGFTITAGYQTTFYPGGALDGGASLRNCRIQGNYGKDYGPITVWDSNLSLVNCDVFSNTGGTTGGIHTYGTNVTLISCRIKGNHANIDTRYESTGAVLLTGGEHLIENCLITGNRAPGVGGVNMVYGNDNGDEAAGHMLVIRNTTISGNLSYGDVHEFTTDIGGIRTGFGSDTYLHNSIVWGNSPLLEEGSDGLLSENIEYSLVEGSTPGGTNFDGTNPANDPDFQSPVDPVDTPTAGGNFRLLAESPMIGAGDASLLGDDVADLDRDGDTDEPLPLDVIGNARIIETLDLGAIEHVVAEEPLNSLEEFRAFHGLSGDGSDDSSESEENGLPILLNYAFGIEDTDTDFVPPADPDNGTPGLPSLEPSNNGSTLEFNYVRRVDSETELSFTIQKSSDLSNWTDISDEDGSIIGTSIIPFNEQYEFVVVEFEPAAGSVFYYRLNVEAAE